MSMENKGSLERRLASSEHQQKIYTTLLTRRMNRPQMEKEFGLGKLQLSVYLRIMREKGQLLTITDYKLTLYYSNPRVPYEIPAYIKGLVARKANLEAIREAERIAKENAPPPYLEQVNPHTRIIRLMDKRPLNSTMPRKKTKASKFVSMGSGMQMFVNWE